MGDVLCTSQGFFTCLRVLRLADSNLSGMEKVYYYSRMTKQCIEKKTRSWLSDIFPGISSPDNIWNMSNDKSDEEESISNNLTLYSENICFVISSLCKKREEHINTDYAVTGWMLCVIPHIRENVFKIHKINIIFRWTMLSKLCFLDQLKRSYMELLISSGANTIYSNIIMIPLTAMNLSGTVNILLMETVIYVIRNTLYRPPRFLVL